MANQAFLHGSYLVRRQVFKLLGAALHVYAADGTLVFYTKQKAFKLREDIRLFADESMSQELLSIQAQKIIDFSSAYAVVDSVKGEPVGMLRRKGFKSLVQDEWEIIDAAGRQIGIVREDSTSMALLRRFVDFAAFLFPQRYEIKLGERTVGVLQQNRNPFIFKIAADFSMDAGGKLDPRLKIAAAVLVALVEGRQA